MKNKILARRKITFQSKAHLLPSVFILLSLLAVGAIPFAQAQRNAAKPAGEATALKVAKSLAPDSVSRSSQPATTAAMAGAHILIAPLAPKAPQVVLYDQYNNLGANATLSATFTDFPTFSSDLADDFIVPSGQTWSIQSIDADGVYFNGMGPANSWNVFIYADAGGMPGAVLFSVSNTTVTQINTTYTVNLSPAACPLPTGHYWVEIQANMTFNPNGEWGWTDRIVQSGSPAQWQNPGGGFGMCPTWMAKQAVCVTGASGPDQVFRLNGILNPASCGPTPTPTATPTPTPTPSPTPTPTPTPTPCPGNQYTITPGAAPIVPGVTDTGNHCDDCVTSVPIPFPFQLYNQAYNSVGVVSNGFLDFVTPNNSFSPVCLPATGFDYTIYGLWHDLRTDTGLSGCSNFASGCGIFTSTTGSAPNRIFNIEWRAVRFSDNTQTVNFEVRLYENNPNKRFDIVYGTSNGVTTADTAGVQGNAGAGFFTQDLCNAPAPQNVSRTYTLAGCGAPLCGSYTVGAGGDFSSLTNPGGFFEAVNGAGLTCSVEALIISDLTNETGAIPLNQWTVSPQSDPSAPACGCIVTIRRPGMIDSPNGSCVNPVRTISGVSTGSGLIKLNGPDGVIIDGSCGGLPFGLTITNGNANAAVIWIASASASDGANNITVENCVISGAPGVTAIAGIVSGSGTILGGDAEAPNNNITIQNNNIFRVQNSCYLRGTTAGTDTGLVVTGNTFGSTVAGDKNIFRGMLVGNSTGFLIRGNTINGVVSTASSTSKTTGIQTALVINGGTIEKNVISDIKQINPGTYGATGIDLTGGNNILVKNNFVSDVNHDMSGGAAFSTLFGVFGVQIEAGTGIQVYDNSVNLFGSIGTNNSSLLDAAFGINATTSTGCDVRDNIFANNITGGTTSVAHVAVYLPSGGTSAMNLTENNNSYYNGPDAARQGVGQAGTTAGINFFVTLPQLKSYSMTLSPPGTNDNASIASTGAVPFMSASDLHLVFGAPEIGLGIPIAVVTDDIDGDPRSPTMPTIGADEPRFALLTMAVSRKTHGGAGAFDINLPLSGTNGVECRTGGGTNDYTIVATFAGNVTVTGSPQAQLTMGAGCVGSGGVCTGNVTVSGNIVTVPLTTVANVQNINVRINGVNSAGSDAPATDFNIPMGILVGDTNGNRTVNAADVAQTKGRLGQALNGTNFRSDVNANGSINAADTAIIKQNSGTSIP